LLLVGESNFIFLFELNSPMMAKAVVEKGDGIDA